MVYCIDYLEPPVKCLWLWCTNIQIGMAVFQWIMRDIKTTFSMSQLLSNAGMSATCFTITQHIGFCKYIVICFISWIKWDVHVNEIKSGFVMHQPLQQGQKKPKQRCAVCLSLEKIGYNCPGAANWSRCIFAEVNSEDDWKELSVFITTSFVTR